MTATLTPTEVSESLGISPRTLAAWRQAGRGPRFTKLGYRTVRYRSEDVERWLAARAERL